MGRAEPDEETLNSCREQFPRSLIGVWSTFGDGYQMEFGQSAAFDPDGTGIFEMWDAFDDKEADRTFPFRWRVLQGFQIAVQIEPTEHVGDWGRFIVEFFLSEDEYGNKYVAIRDGRQSQGMEPFWWFADPQKHPMRRLQEETEA